MCYVDCLLQYGVLNRPIMQMEILIMNFNGALQTGTETGFNGSGFNVVSRELHTTCIIRGLQCWTGTHAL